MAFVPGAEDLLGEVFVEAQGHSIDNEILCQENESVGLSQKNGKTGSSMRTRHLNVRHFS